jgi:hypothetical protein
MAERPTETGLSLPARLEARARTRFARWDADVWRDLCAGPARRLERGLVSARLEAEAAEAVLTSYLSLACEGVGLGYIYPEGTAGDSFVARAWRELLPEALPRLRPDRMSQILADCWNLGENLERSPTWVRRIFLRALGPTVEGRLDDLQGLVTQVSRAALGEPEKKLGPVSRRHWIHLAEDDPHFLPGKVQFLAPTVVAVHDRHRREPGSAATPTVGVWLADPPVPLGSLGSLEPPAEGAVHLELLEELARADPSAAEVREMAVNEWRAAVTLELSQFLVALQPA